MVSITSIFHIILTVIRYELIIQVQKASNAISKIGMLHFTYRYNLYNWRYEVLNY